MKIIFSQKVINNYSYFFITKTLESDFIPRQGEYIYDGIYCYPGHEKEDYKIETVTISYEEEKVYILIEPMKVEEQEEFENIKNQITKYNLCQWKIK